jgi:perosamine synthetase
MIQVCKPNLEGNETKYVLDCLSSNWISSSGKYIEEFEKKFAEYCGVKHGISCTSGTTALHLALLALGIKEGDEVIVPDFTMIASGNAVIYTGATPVFVDSELDTWNMDISKIEAKITKKTKAIMVMHTYGCPCNMDDILKLAKEHDLFIVEDAAEAIGSEYKGIKAGAFGDISAFSFYANKTITCGEGGMVVTNDDALAEKVRSLKNHCFSKPRFIHNDIGYNYRMTNIQAAIGLAQLERIDKLLNTRIQNAMLYNELLSKVDGITFPPESKSYYINSYWVYGILIDEKKFGMSKETLMKKLEEQGIETRSFFHPMHSQPAYKNIKCAGKYPVSEKLWNEGLYLPSYYGLTREDIKHICFIIKNLVKD